MLTRIFTSQFPVAVATNPKNHKHVCVVNGGKVNGVACYASNHTSGLSLLNNTVRSLDLNQTTPATGPAGSVSDVLFSEDGKRLLVSVKGAPPVQGSSILSSLNGGLALTCGFRLGFIASWDVAADGSLSKDFIKVPATAGALVRPSCAYKCFPNSAILPSM